MINRLEMKPNSLKISGFLLLIFLSVVHVLVTDIDVVKNRIINSELEGRINEDRVKV